MQSISQSNEVCIFIDKAWINFIMELNLKLRSLRRYSLSGDLTVFMQNLLEERLVGSLGGMITQFCCFSKPNHDMNTSSSCSSSPKSSPDRDQPSASSPVTPRPNKSVRVLHHSSSSVDQNVFDANIKNTDMLSEFASIRNVNSTSTRSLNTPNPTEPGTSDASHLVDERVVNGRGNIPLASDIGEMKRPVGYGETCRLIMNGEIFPGLIFFHESTPVEDVVGNVASDEAANISGANRVATPGSVTKLDNSEGDDVYGGGSKGVYGDKIDELDRFYKILADADEKNVSHSEIPACFSDGDSLYSGSQSSLTPSSLVRHRTDSHHTVDSSEVSSALSLDFPKEFHGQNIDNSHSLLLRKKVGRQVTCCGSAVRVWSWCCKSSKPMILTKEEFSNSTSVSNLKIVYPTTVEVVGEALSHFFRCGTVLQQRKYTVWEHILRLTSMMSRIILHGTNKLPRGRLFRKLMTALFVLFIFVDIGCTCFLTLSYWCVWGNRTSCNNHTGVVLMQSVWPGALVMAPLMGLRVMILNSTGTMARQYVCWSRLACFNCIMMIVIYLKWTENAKTFLNIPLLISYAGSRLFQNYYFDYYIATVENKRTSRGWNGLHTSIINFENHEFT